MIQQQINTGNDSGHEDGVFSGESSFFQRNENGNHYKHTAQNGEEDGPKKYRTYAGSPREVARQITVLVAKAVSGAAPWNAGETDAERAVGTHDGPEVRWY